MVFEVFLDSDERFRWHLRDRHGQVIARSASAHADLDTVIRCLAEVRDSGRADIRHPQA